jgi:cytoskeletal protein CcmA (bactofilin family)
MFVRNEKPETAAQPAVPQHQHAVPEPQGAVPPRGAARTRAVSIISADLIVKGTLSSAGDIHLEGRLEGDIRAGGLIVGEKAILIGDIFAEEAIIRGRVEGDIKARKTQLCSTCHVEGDIVQETLSIEHGAYFEGNCRRADPASAHATADATASKPTTERKPSAPKQPSVEKGIAVSSSPPSAPMPLAAQAGG